MRSAMKRSLLLAAAVLALSGASGQDAASTSSSILPSMFMTRSAILDALQSGRNVSVYGGVLAHTAGATDPLEEAAVVDMAAAFVRRQLGLAPDTQFQLDGAAVRADLVYSEARGVESSITWERPLTPVLPDVPEFVTETPAFGRMYWLALVARHSLPQVGPLLGGEGAGGSWVGATTAAALTEEEAAALPQVRHTLLVSVGVPDRDINFYQHTYGLVDAVAPGSASVSVGADGSTTTTSATGAAGSSGWSAPFTIMTSNAWNVNPPKWLWRDPRDRWRQYGLRLFHLGDATRTAVPGTAAAAAAGSEGSSAAAPVPFTPDIIAFQEVRYDTTLGGFDQRSANDCDVAASDGSVTLGSTVRTQNRCTDEAAYDEPAVVDRRYAYDYKMAWAIGSKWYNSTRAYSKSDRYRTRTDGKWKGISTAGGWSVYGASHPLEGDVGSSEPADAAAAEATPTPAPAVEGEVPPPPAPPAPRGRSPFVEEAQHRGPPSFPRIHRAMQTHPHAQIHHLAAHLPGYQYVYQPGQLYLDRNAWQSGSVHKDEEGPAIFSRWPIVSSDYMLLSRNTSDDGDGHQRVVLHAVIDASAAAGSPLLVDVYTVHLALSEAARNRTVVELLRFVATSAQGALQVVCGDMNAEPHEPAMAALMAAGVHLVDTSSGSGSSGGVALPQLRDVWRQKYPEPTPRDSDAAVRRYAFTFPADDPVKRIDLVAAGYRGAADAAKPLCEGGDASGVAGVVGGCVQVDAVWVTGQDPLPGTESAEGRGGGMVSEQSPIFASDHRAVVTQFRVPVQA